MRKLLLAFFICSCWAQVGWANVVANGGFEDALTSGWSASYHVERTIDKDSTYTYFNAYDGHYALDLEYSGTGNLSGYAKQTLNTVAGQSYKLSFAMAGNYFNLRFNSPIIFDTKHLEILWNGSSVGQFDYTPHAGDTYNNVTWDIHSLTLTARGNDVLEFYSRNPTYSGYGALIDGVSLELVPLLQFRFEEGSGTTISSSGSVAGVAGTLQEGKIAGNGPGFSTDTPQGIGSSSSLQFDGINDMVRFPDVFDYTVDGSHGGTPLTQLTVEAWIKPSSLGGQRVIWDDYGSPGVSLYLSGDRVQFGLSTASNPGGGIANYSGKIATGVWQHIAGVYDGQRLHVYVDGQESEATVATSGAIQDNTSVNPSGAFMAIGADSVSIPALNYEGFIDDLRIYGVALDRTQLAGGFFAQRPLVQCQNYYISEKGAKSLTTSGVSDIQVGYARVQSSGGSAAPAALAAFNYQVNDVLVTETTVPASALVQSGRIPAFMTGSLNAGLAIANPFSQKAKLDYFFTDTDGNNFKAGSTEVPAYSQISQFLTEPPFNGTTSTNGSFSFTSSSPVAVVALRGLWNEQNDFLLTTLPLVDTSTATSDPVVIPHYADGGGWATEILLVNPGNRNLSGTMEFYDQGTETVSAQPVSMELDGTTSTLFHYTIPARSAKRMKTSGSVNSTRAGSIRVTPASGDNTPTALVVFSMKRNELTVTEAGVLSTKPSLAFRMYAEASGEFGQPGSIQSGFAVSNPSSNSISVLFELLSSTGQATGLSQSLAVPGNGQRAMFLNGIAGFDSLQLPFKGILRISTTAPTGIVVTGLRCRYNERNDFLITTTAAADEMAAITTAETLFPQVVDGGGYKTQFIWFSNVPGQAHTVCTRYLTKSGAYLGLDLH